MPGPLKLAWPEGSVSVGAGPGYGSAGVHHGELVQGVFEHDGHLRRGLVSLPCDRYLSRAVFTPTSAATVAVWPRAKVKARRAAECALARLDVPTGGILRVANEIPESRGFGSSTSDVLAAIRAVLDAYGCPDLPSGAIAKLAVQAETASDALMFTNRTVLFAHRDGVVIEDFGRPLPRIAVLGFGTSRSGRGINTLALPTATYLAAEVDAFREMRSAIREAMLAGDVELLGRMATWSTKLNQRHLPMGWFECVGPLIADVGAVGLQCAHSGDIAGLLFNAEDPDTRRRQDLAVQRLGDMGIRQTWRFTTGG